MFDRVVSHVSQHFRAQFFTYNQHQFAAELVMNLDFTKMF